MAVASRKHLVLEDLDDPVIVDLLAARESRAMEFVYDRWASLTYTIALRLVHEPAEAEKIVLEAYLALWRQPELALQHCDSIRAYLCAVVACDARLRRLKSRPLNAAARVESESLYEVEASRLQASG